MATNKNFTKPFRPAEGSTEQKALNKESTQRSQDQNPSVNKGVWAEAEHAAYNQTGGFSGATKEGRKIAIQAKYDQMIENDKQLKKWAGDGGILGDV